MKSSGKREERAVAMTYILTGLLSPTRELLLLSVSVSRTFDIKAETFVEALYAELLERSVCSADAVPLLLQHNPHSDGSFPTRDLHPLQTACFSQDNSNTSPCPSSAWLPSTRQPQK